MRDIRAFFKRLFLFISRQQHDWKVTVVRTSLDRLAYQIVFPYLSVYIVVLGASATQLGLVNSLGMVVAGLVGPFTGWFIDREGPKRFYLAGIGILAISYMTYGLAHSWHITIVAMTAYWLGYSLSIHSCATICGNCLINQDRATGMTICETIAAGLLGMIGPMLAAWIVNSSGGVNAAGIKPLFFLGLLITAGTFFYVLAQLSNQRWGQRQRAGFNLLRDLYEVLQHGRYLKRWLVIAAIGQLPLGMVFAFSQVFAHEIKGADAYVLGAMVTGSAVISIVFAAPLGRLADRIGRKNVLFLTIPLFWASNLLLIWAPQPKFLIVAGALQGFFYISGPIAAAMERELVPAHHMGRWIGIARMVKMLLNAILVLAAGFIWDRVGPQYVFLAFVGVDIAIRMPLLLSMPETLNKSFDRELPAGGG